VSTAAPRLRVVMVVFADGERCPMLVNDDGIPLFDANVWSLTKYRHRSPSTMEQALRGAMFLHLFCLRCLSKKLSGAASDCVSDFAVVGVALGVEADVANRRPVADLA